MLTVKLVYKLSNVPDDLKWARNSAGSIPGFVRYRSIPEFCSILDTHVVSLIFT